MPITSSAKKALRQSKRNREENILRARAISKAYKAYKGLVAKKDFAAAEKALSPLFKALDKAAKTHVIPENRASRLKSRLSRLIRVK